MPASDQDTDLENAEETDSECTEGMHAAERSAGKTLPEQGLSVAQSIRATKEAESRIELSSQGGESTEQLTGWNPAESQCGRSLEFETLR